MRGRRIAKAHIASIAVASIIHVEGSGVAPTGGATDGIGAKPNKLGYSGE